MHYAEPFFAYARERQAILIRRRGGLPRSAWTKDPILSTYRFCNVFREDDVTTQWLAQHVRANVSEEKILLATVLFRWFNRITTGEAIFSQLGPDRLSAWDSLAGYGVEAIPGLKDAILAHCGKGPYVTGSYIIKTPDGMNKLSGVLWCLEKFMTESQPIELGYKMDQSEVNRLIVHKNETIRVWDHLDYRLRVTDRPEQLSLELVWNWLRKFPYLGDFMAYEIVTDLSQTTLRDAPDIRTWANPGPGATRGLGRLLHGSKDHFRPSQKAILNGHMQELLALSRDNKFWPTQVHDSMAVGDYADGWGPTEFFGSWPFWDMRTVEHTLCEYDKYTRVLTGEGRPRGTYR